MTSLDRFRLPLQPTPAAVLQAVARGVQRGSFPPVTQATAVLGGAQPPQAGAWRDPQGRVLVTCTTELPGCTPALVDWWFGWHLPSSERYRLWHPTAHVRATVREDRSALRDDRARYIGNVSQVDEYIGRTLKKLAIAFVPPVTFGIHGLDAAGATAICAHTSDRLLHSQGGSLVHWVRPTTGGAQMRSGFWLGELQHHQPLIDSLLRPLLGSRLLRQAVIGDRMALDLLQHCGEEMAHLARFLPLLHAQVRADELDEARAEGRAESRTDGRAEGGARAG